MATRRTNRPVTRDVVKPRSGRAMIGKLKTEVRRYERRYEVASDVMRQAVKAGYYRETAEISKWMQTHQVLKRVSGKTDTAGTHTRTTGKSTRPV